MRRNPALRCVRGGEARPHGRCHPDVVGDALIVTTEERQIRVGPRRIPPETRDSNCSIAGLGGEAMLLALSVGRSPRKLPPRSFTPAVGGGGSGGLASMDDGVPVVGVASWVSVDNILGGKKK